MNGKSENPTDADIAAWLDGELDKDGAADMSKLAASDDFVALRAQRIRHLDDLVRCAVPSDEAVPEALLKRLGLAARPEPAQVVDLDVVREARLHRIETKTRAAGWPIWRIAAQISLVAGLGIAVAIWRSPVPQDEDDAPYRTLSNASRGVAANGLVVFAAGTDEGTARSVARSVGARLVGRPNDAGAWKLVLPAGRRDAMLAALRADRRVNLAEPIDGQQP